MGMMGLSSSGSPTCTILPPRRAHHTASSHVDWNPAASMATSAPTPSVAVLTPLRTCSAPRLASTEAYAPRASALARASGLTSYARRRGVGRNQTHLM
jgi:hypothetical protein